MAANQKKGRGTLGLKIYLTNPAILERNRPERFLPYKARSKDNRGQQQQQWKTSENIKGHGRGYLPQQQNYKKTLPNTLREDVEVFYFKKHRIFNKYN